MSEQVDTVTRLMFAKRFAELLCDGVLDWTDLVMVLGDPVPWLVHNDLDDPAMNRTLERIHATPPPDAKRNVRGFLAIRHSDPVEQAGASGAANAAVDADGEVDQHDHKECAGRHHESIMSDGHQGTVKGGQI